MTFNWLAIVVAAIVPFALGFLWYGMLFPKAWKQAAGVTDEQEKSGNMALIFGLSFLFNLMFVFNLHFIVIHQMGLNSLFMSPEGAPAPDSVDGKLLAQLMSTYGDRYRTFGHGAFHGILTGLFFALPIIGITALYERKSWKYIAINAAYWIILLAITGGIICGWR